MIGLNEFEALMRVLREIADALTEIAAKMPPQPTKGN